MTSRLASRKRVRPDDAPHPQAREIAAALRGRIEGEVRFGPGDRALYSTDSSSYRQVPIGVVIPRTVDDVVATVATCREFEVPVLSRGGGTSLAGQCCNVAVVIDHSKYLNRILDIDRDRKLARVQAGTILDDLRNLGESGRPRLTFGPTPSTHRSCTIGGMMGNNACGNYSIMSEFYGPGPRMSHNVAEIEVLTYDGARFRVTERCSDQELSRIVAAGGRRGEIHHRLRELRDRYADLVRERFPDFPRRVSGFNLDHLLPEQGFNVAGALVGTESTCVTFLEATLHLLDSPPARSVVVAGFEDLYAAAAAVMTCREHRPIALEGFDEVLVDANKLLGVRAEELYMLPDGRGWLLVEFGGATDEESHGRGHDLIRSLQKAPGFREARVYEHEAARRIWEVRESALGVTAFVPGRPDTAEGWEDSAVPPERLPEYLRGLRSLFQKYGFGCALYGHFGQGCVHTRIDFDLTSEEGIRKYRSFTDEAADLLLSHGGSLSGEHGDGQSRGELLEKMFGKELVEAFREFKSIWDPDWRMNPGKVVDANPRTSWLQLGADYRPAPVRTHFAYPEDRGDFAHAAFRCVGVGKCRRTEGGTMCPSFMVTREEEHSTRGRARMLFEMLNGSEIDLWRSSEVHDALELCLACKGCKAECPVSVDMATYKAEFLSHHYKGRVRPRAAYALGLIYWWARIGSRVPRAANFVTQAPVVSSLVKRLGGLAPLRPAPAFAPEPFVQWFRARGIRNRERPPVLLWPDTFTNFFHTEAAKATVEVLEAAGHRVLIPDRPLCCGRPLYDYGMLDTAKRLLVQILESLRPHIRAGIPVIGVEPSCLVAFRDELPNLLPHDEDAKRLSRQSFLLSEFLVDRKDWDPPKLHRKAVVHAHCHQKAIVGFESDRKLLEQMELDFEILDSGCCGLAGSFGYEAGEKYEVAQKCGERVLLPKVREASPDTLIITDGFSCRGQIDHNTDRRALHVAQVIRLALHEGPTGPNTRLPEHAAEHPDDTGRRNHRALWIAAGVAGGAVAALALRRARSPRS